MKRQELFWSAVILVLIAASAWVMVGTHYDTRTHQRVANYPVRYGLDIKGGVRAVLQAHPEKAPGVPYDQATVQRILENRINSAGVGEATVQPKGTTQFIVELPDVKNKNALLEQLGTTAQMTFYYFQDVKSQHHPNAPIDMSEGRDPATGREHTIFYDNRTHQTFRDGAQIRADFTSLLSQGTAQRPGATLYTVPAPLSANLEANGPVYFTPAQQAAAADLNRELNAWQGLLKDSPLIMTGADIEPKSSARLGGTLGTDPAVSQVFTAKGAAEFARFTTDHVGDIMGIVLDDAVLSAPNIESPITDGEGEIHGGFATLSEAQSLANLLNAGALPVPLEQVQTESVEASLGVGAVHKSFIAGAVGLALVLLFMVLYYRLPGLLADVALLIYALFVFAIFRGGLFKVLGLPAVTLTLPGIAGFILSIGMAVDANILIFERLKEELRNGRALRPAIDAGFRRAFTAIRDSNICTCITCVVLLSLGTASVRGFALTLLIGVIVSLFSAITITRTLLYLLVDAGIGNNTALFGLNTRSLVGQTTAGGTRAGFNIIGRRKFFYGLSLAIIVPGLIFWAMGGLKRSIEFTGGTQIEVRYTRPVSQAEVERALSAAGFDRPSAPHVQMAEGGTVAIVSTAQRSSVSNPLQNPVRQQLVRALDPLAPHSADQQKFIPEFGNVQGIISRELTSRALQAVIIASVLIVLYLATVFSIGGFAAGLRFGTSAVIALLHDVLVLLGSFAILGYFLNWEIDSLFVTAMLTVIGFSVHDTVVIFDRVRENLHNKPRGEAFEQTVNRSIQQTLARSINTSLTVVLTLIALLVLGGQTTRLLNAALLIGIVSGTYSSIFNAASILVDWENWLAKRRGTAPRVAVAAASPTPVAAGGGGARAFTAPRPETPPALGAAGSPINGHGAAPGQADGAGASRIRPKKKRPARRF